MVVQSFGDLIGDADPLRKGQRWTTESEVTELIGAVEGPAQYHLGGETLHTA